MIQLSVVLPVHNEQENIQEMFREIDEVCQKHQYDYEAVFVDDGSSDKSFTILEEMAQEHKQIKLIGFKRNFGQTAAMSAGIDYASGQTIILMDSDLQNDPNDIPMFLKEINNGHDVVVGWRKERKDNTLNRKIPSMIANWLIRKVGGVQINDLGCSMKAFNREIIKQVRLYGEMHRFIPLYTSAIGGKLTEVVVNHRARVAGETKYGINRTFKVILDLITVKFLIKYSTKPMYFFGGAALGFWALSILTSIFLMIHKFAHEISIIRSPFLILTCVLVMIGFNFILMGLLSEMIMRTYYESQNKKSYIVEKMVNIDD